MSIRESFAGSVLLGDEHQAEAPFADLLHELVRSDHRAWPFVNRLVFGGGHSWRGSTGKAGRLFVGGQQAFHGGTQFSVVAAMIGEIGWPIRHRQFGGGKEQVANKLGIGWHGMVLRGHSTRHAALGENDVAFDALEQAVVEREFLLAWLAVGRSHIELMSLESIAAFGRMARCRPLCYDLGMTSSSAPALALTMGTF